MAAVSHPNLATLYGLELWRGVPMLVIEYLEGGTLADRLRRGPLAVDQVVKLGLALAEAAGALHAVGMLHRDIKPSNIGFTAEGTPKLLDFGLAKLVTRPSPATGGSGGNDSTWSVQGSMSTEAGIRGTPAYLSPESLSGAPPSAADDVWALSVTLIEASTGINPFKAATIPATVARVLTHENWVNTAGPSEHRLSSLLVPGVGTGTSRPPTTTKELVSRLERIDIAG
jgi:serine/threonine protein kinase